MNWIEKFFIKRWIKNFKRKVKKMADKEGKHWLLSKGLWLAVVTVVIGAAGMFGITGLEIEKESLVDALVELATALAGIGLILDRILSKHKKLRFWK